MGYDVPATHCVTDAQAQLLLVVARHTRQGRPIPPDKILAQELSRSRQMINSHRLQLESAGILERTDDGCQLATYIITDPKLARVAIFAWDQCRRAAPSELLSTNELAVQISQKFSISLFKASQLIEVLLGNDYLEGDDPWSIKPGECGRYERKYLELLAASE